jgi:hypothetical protein
MVASSLISYAVRVAPGISEEAYLTMLGEAVDREIGAAADDAMFEYLGLSVCVLVLVRTRERDPSVLLPFAVGLIDSG